MSILDHNVGVKRSDGSQQIVKICPLYGRDDEGVVKVTWIRDGDVVAKYVHFCELDIFDLKTANQPFRTDRDIKKLLVNVAYTTIVVATTVYCLDVLVKWYRKNEVITKL